MTPKNLKVFLDTSVIFAGILSPSGGSRKLLPLGEIGLLQLVAGPKVLRECEEVVRQKAPASLPILAQLLSLSRVETCSAPTDQQIALAKTLVAYAPDATVLAEALAAEPDWFVTHDKAHFLREGQLPTLAFQVGTPGDLIQSLKDSAA